MVLVGLLNFILWLVIFVFSCSLVFLWRLSSISESSAISTVVKSAVYRRLLLLYISLFS